MPRKDANTGQISAKAQQDLVSEGIENFELPKSIVAKIAKSAVRGATGNDFGGDAAFDFTVAGECKAAKGDGSVACKGFDGVYKLSWCVERPTGLCDGSLGLMPDLQLRRECWIVLPSVPVVLNNDSRAHDVAQSKQHKSISASDVLKALELLEFGDLVEPLQSELLGEVIYYTVPQPGAHVFYF
jgi:hypothetical protein